ncbi:hypothetical protein [Sphingomonas sp. DC2300-3]|uniref:hypothetical protein n=1 Tax=unclassified Sphingomonas TaxID=196159 RepID=UPI003CF25EBB
MSANAWYVLATCGPPEGSPSALTPFPVALRLIDVHTGCRARIVQVYDLVVGTLADVCHGA